MVTVEPVAVAIANGYDAEDASASMLTVAAVYGCSATAISCDEISTCTPNISMTDAVSSTYGLEINSPDSDIFSPPSRVGPTIMRAEMN